MVFLGLLMHHSDVSERHPLLDRVVSPTLLTYIPAIVSYPEQFYHLKLYRQCSFSEIGMPRCLYRPDLV